MKSERIHLPSFLGDDEQIISKQLSFKHKSITSLRMMIRQQLNEQAFNHKFMSSHRQQLDVPHFVLQAEDRHKTWIIIKRLEDILALEKQLKNKYTTKVPFVPIRKQSELTSKNQEQVLLFFEVFMNALAGHKEIKEQKVFNKFIQNFVSPQRKKMKTFKQLQLRKRAGGRHNQSILKKFASYFINWDKKMFTISSEGVYYTASDKDFRIQQMIPYTVGFKILYGEKDTCSTYGIMINSAHRLLILDAENIFDFTYFVYFVKKALNENDCSTPKLYGSFASVRTDCNAKYYIDGKNYFEDLHDALLTAKTEVCITGWMISPFFCLKRPDPQYKTRVDNVLSKIANLGIKIHIIIFMEPKIALNIDSEFTETYLTKLSSNIKVLRHPAYVVIPFLWSHHQKMVIIDQKVAFMGGLDIGYGRYDDNEHRLTDIDEQFWPGVDYCNYRKVDILKPQQFKKCSIDRKCQPRMPWHDVAVRIIGRSVIDLSRHFVQFWNYVNFQLNMDQRQLLMYAGFQQQDIQKLSKPKQKQKFQTNKSKADQRKKSFVDFRKGKNYTSQKIDVVFDFEQNDTQESSDKAQQKIVDEEQLKKDHQQQMQFYANHLQVANSNSKGSSKERLLNMFNELTQGVSGRQAQTFEEDLVVTQVLEDKQLSLGKQKHQILRSASMWSLGLDEDQTQRSIGNAYIELIESAKEFIYIENQFFICVENQVSEAIIKRITQAYNEKKKFRVVVVIPSLPGFDGEVYNEVSAVMRVQVHHIYSTICRGKKSILQRLSFIDNIDNYIQFFTLRTYGVFDEKTIVSELIYVHSKLLIIDDKIALIGSANINDRSLLGSRDSEIAVVIEDEQYLQINKVRNAKDLKESQVKVRTVGKFSHNLRVQLFMEHFGLTRAQTQDYFNEQTWWKMSGQAFINQQIYRDYFGIYPDNKMQTYKDIFEIQKNKKQPTVSLLKENIRGNAVLFQRNFLIKQNLDLKASQKQFYVPAISFT